MMAALIVGRRTSRSGLPSAACRTLLKGLLILLAASGCQPQFTTIAIPKKGAFDGPISLDDCDRKYRVIQSADSGQGKLRVKLGLNSTSRNWKNGLTAPEDLELQATLEAWASRISVEWEWIELQPGVYHWQDLDRIVGASKMKGLEPWALVTGAPEHACRPGTRRRGPGGSCPPRTELYEAFLQQLAARYRGKVRYYEIWNEPDLDWFWTGGATPAEYAELLISSHRAIKAVDSQAEVVMGATAGTKLPYLGKILAHLKGQRVYDAVAIHPYRILAKTNSITVAPSETRRVPDGNGRERSVDFLGEIRLYRDLLDTSGNRGVPMWITEVGWGAHDEMGGRTVVTLTQQAQYLTETYDILSRNSDLLVYGLFWYTDRDWASDPTDIQAHRHFGLFGLVRYDRSLKPAACVFRQLARFQRR